MPAIAGEFVIEPMRGNFMAQGMDLADEMRHPLGYPTEDEESGLDAG